MDDRYLSHIHQRIQESRHRIVASDVAVRHAQKSLARMRESVQRAHLEMAQFKKVLERWREMGN
jgi:hypothetical protein